MNHLEFQSASTTSLSGFDGRRMNPNLRSVDLNPNTTAALSVPIHSLTREHAAGAEDRTSSRMMRHKSHTATVLPDAVTTVPFVSPPPAGRLLPSRTYGGISTNSVENSGDTAMVSDPDSCSNLNLGVNGNGNVNVNVSMGFHASAKTSLEEREPAPSASNVLSSIDIPGNAFAVHPGTGGGVPAPATGKPDAAAAHASRRNTHGSVPRSPSAHEPYRHCSSALPSAMADNRNTSTPQNDIPYISVEGRRKRRRTTFEDAFHHCLSMDGTHTNTSLDMSGVHDLNSSLLMDDDIMTPIRDKLSSEDLFGMQLEGGGRRLDLSTPPNHNHNHDHELNSSSMETPCREKISKRLDYSDQSKSQSHTLHDPNPSQTLHPATAPANASNELGSMSLKEACALTQTQTFRTISSTFTEMDSEENSTGYHSDEISTTSLSEEDGDDEEENQHPAAIPMPILCAPRKGRKQRQNVDIVDERLEELIRHSRLKAMSIIENEKNKILLKAREEMKLQQMREKEMDQDDSNLVATDDNRNMDGDNDTSCVSSSSNDSLRRKNQKEQSFFTGKTTDDLGVRMERGRGRERSQRRSFLSGNSMIGTSSLSRSNSIPRGMKYCESMDLDVNMSS